MPVARALWQGVFTAVSAFCNAGFALDSTSMIPYAERPLILHVTAVLIILGGLGPPVVVALPDWLRGRKTSLHVRLVLWSSLLLTLLPAAFFLASESLLTLDDKPWDQRMTLAWFQSVTLRTAGFTAIDLTQMTPASLSLMMMLMFIGGSPGSTAGGAKTTTLAVLALATWAVLRGKKQPEAFGFRISHRTVYKAGAVILMGIFSVGAALLALQLTQSIELQHILFETISALGTVGLSTGATSRLDEVGKLVIILCMLAGRVGPLTLFLLVTRSERADVWRRPEQEVTVG